MVGAAKHVGGARAQIAEIADGRCDDVQPGCERLIFVQRLTSSNSSEKESFFTFIVVLGSVTMVIWLSASAIILAALQASINAPTNAFRGCLREATAKATSEKVGPDAIEAYLRNACTVEMQSLRNGLIAFRLKNGMARKAANEDAAMTVDDYVATPVENFKFMSTMNASRTDAAAAPTPPPAPPPPSAPK